MSLHLIKLAVGVDDVAALKEIQRQRRQERGAYLFYTRNTPRRAEEILEGGSIYWVIKGLIRARQLIRAFTSMVDEEGAPLCAVRYDRKVVETRPTPRRPFQGWRYLEVKDAPPDLLRGASGGNDLPPALADELRLLGLL